MFPHEEKSLTLPRHSLLQRCRKRDRRDKATPPSSLPPTVEADSGTLAAFFDYCRPNNLKEVRGLLRNGFNVKRQNLMENKRSHMAARHNNPDIVKNSFSTVEPEFVNAKDKYGSTAGVHTSVKYAVRTMRVVKLLIDRSDLFFAKPMTSMTALMWAAYHGDSELRK